MREWSASDTLMGVCALCPRVDYRTVHSAGLVSLHGPAPCPQQPVCKGASARPEAQPPQAGSPVATESCQGPSLKSPGSPLFLRLNTVSTAYLDWVRKTGSKDESIFQNNNNNINKSPCHPGTHKTVCQQLWLQYFISPFFFSV